MPAKVKKFAINYTPLGIFGFNSCNRLYKFTTICWRRPGDKEIRR
jgi:hypothetical protein